jgi:hypothetical protein
MAERSIHRPTARVLLLAAAIPLLLFGCVTQSGGSAGALHRWWSGLGPVLPHDAFPADCKLCHVGPGWNTLTDDFTFDHERETGVPLLGAHAQARCLRCHNDRGPVEVFQARGCAGCHEDFHQGELGKDCTSCHDQRTWQPRGQVERHARTRFPLTGAHVAVACHRCHPGIWTGRVYPADTACVSCHNDDVQQTTNPPHAGLGWVDTCQRCHVTTSWNHAIVR